MNNLNKVLAVLALTVASFNAHAWYFVSETHYGDARYEVFDGKTHYLVNGVTCFHSDLEDGFTLAATIQKENGQYTFRYHGWRIDETTMNSSVSYTGKKVLEAAHLSYCSRH